MPATYAAAELGGSADDGGPRQQPELSEVATYSPEAEQPSSDLSLLDDDDFPLSSRASLIRRYSAGPAGIP